jgi:integrase
MATIYLSLSAKVDATNRQEILIRFSHGRINHRAKTNIFIPAEYTDDNGKRKIIWDDKAQQIVIPNFRLMTDERKELKQYLTDQSERLNALIASTQTSFNDIKDKTNVPPDWLKDCIDKYHVRGKYAPIKAAEQEQTFFGVFDEFLKIKKLSDWRKRAFDVVVRAMRRYELYVQITRDKSFLLAFDDITPNVLSDFDEFLRNEHLFSKQYPEIYKKVPESRVPEPRGQNTINGIFTKIRTFFIWAVNNEKIANNPFRKFKIEECVYGTPYYISIEERNQLYNTDLSHRPGLAVQRDIFVFQCLIGCRVADLYKLTKQNIINRAVEYIARKTKDGRPVTVRVSLNATAKEILAKYAGFEGETLLPTSPNSNTINPLRRRLQ